MSSRAGESSPLSVDCGGNGRDLVASLDDVRRGYPWRHVSSRRWTSPVPLGSPLTGSGSPCSPDWSRASAGARSSRSHHHAAGLASATHRLEVDVSSAPQPRRWPRRCAGAGYRARGTPARTTAHPAGADVEEVCRDDALGLDGEELTPSRAGTTRRRVDARSVQSPRPWRRRSDARVGPTPPGSTCVTTSDSPGPAAGRAS